MAWSGKGLPCRQEALNLCEKEGSWSGLNSPVLGRLRQGPQEFVGHSAKPVIDSSGRLCLRTQGEALS